MQKWYTHFPIIIDILNKTNVTITGGGGGGHIVGHAENKDGVLATSTLDFELAVHYGGPRYKLRIDPVGGIKMVCLQTLIAIRNAALALWGKHYPTTQHYLQ